MNGPGIRANRTARPRRLPGQPSSRKREPPDFPNMCQHSCLLSTVVYSAQLSMSRRLDNAVTSERKIAHYGA